MGNRSILWPEERSPSGNRWSGVFSDYAELADIVPDELFEM